MTSAGLNDQFAALQAEREQNWPAQQLAKVNGQRASLVERHDPAAHVQVGDRIAPFTFTDADGHAITSDVLLADGPVVLIFYRFGACPACNIALPYYNEHLWPVLEAAGIPLIAVSPQTPVDLAPINRHRLGFPLASDVGYTLGRALGITFFPDDQPPVTEGEGWIGATLGTNSYELVKPAILILEKDRIIRFIHVSPDWLVRAEAGTVLDHLPEARRVSDGVTYAA